MGREPIPEPTRRALGPPATEGLEPIANPGLSIEPLAIGIGSGVLAVINGPAPTGGPIVDAVLVGGGIAMITWFSSVNRIRFCALIALLAGALSLSWIGLLLGVAALVFGVRAETARRPSPLISAGLAGLALNIASRSELGLFLGASAVVGLALAAGLVARAFPHRTRPVQRVALAFVAAAATVTVVSALALGFTGARSIDDLRAGEQIVRSGLDQLGDGEIRDAQASFELASQTFDRANSRLASPLTAPAALVPVAAQHRRAAVELSADAKSASDTLAEQLGRVDLDQLIVDDGRIDVRAIAALEEPMTLIQTDISGLRTNIERLDGPWLASSLRDDLDDLVVEIDQQLERGDDLVRVARQVPPMLGAEGPRVYFVAFTTPAEARGLGGFMGNWAELTIENGRIELTAVGRSDDLDAVAVSNDAVLTGPTDWVRRYGDFDFDDSRANGTGENPWKNITVSPDMEATGQVMAELYPQSGGERSTGCSYSTCSLCRRCSSSPDRSTFPTVSAPSMPNRLRDSCSTTSTN